MNANDEKNDKVGIIIIKNNICNNLLHHNIYINIYFITMNIPNFYVKITPIINITLIMTQRMNQNINNDEHDNVSYTPLILTMTGQPQHQW